MAQGKNAYIRYKVLDRCFRDSRRHYYMEDLVEACNEVLYNYDGSSVSERTIREDIHFMQRQAGGGVPLERKMDGHRAYYMYSDRNFSIQNLPMSQSEAEMLSDTIQMLSRFKGLPNQEWLNATLVQMKSTFNIGQAKASYVSLVTLPKFFAISRISIATDFFRRLSTIFDSVRVSVCALCLSC